MVLDLLEAWTVALGGEAQMLIHPDFCNHFGKLYRPHETGPLFQVPWKLGWRRGREWSILLCAVSGKTHGGVKTYVLVRLGGF